MKAVRNLLALVLACAAVSQACAWSVRQSNKKKTHVQVLVVDEERKPVPGQKVSFKLSGGGGRKFTLASNKDGMVSFRDDIGSYAICSFDLDDKVYYPVWFEFQPDADGSVVTGVVKRVVEHTRKVEYRIKGLASNGVERVGIDLVYGDFVRPIGEGRYADLYITSQNMRDESVQSDDEWRKVYSRYGFARSNSQSEFSVIDKDVGCELPTPTFAPTTMLNNSNVLFDVDFRPGKFMVENIGDKKYVVFKAVRPQGVYYGVLTDGKCCWSRRDSCNSYEISCSLNINNGDRNIVWNQGGCNVLTWREKVKAWYAEEDAEKSKKIGGQDKEAAK